MNGFELWGKMICDNHNDVAPGASGCLVCAEERIDILEKQNAWLKEKVDQLLAGGGGSSRGGKSGGKKQAAPRELAEGGKMPFGKYKGKDVSAVASLEDSEGKLIGMDYLQWLWDQDLTGQFELKEPLKSHIREVLEAAE